MHTVFRTIKSYATLSKPEHRLLIWFVLTVCIFFSKFEWLGNLSLYKRFGLEFMPSIGLTRSYWLILHGRLSEAYEMNPLIFIVLAIGIPLLIFDAYTFITRLRKNNT